MSDFVLTDKERAEINADWEEFWRPILTDDPLAPDEHIDFERIKAELHDYHIAIQEVGRVYDYVTNGKLTKPNTAATHVIAEHERQINEAYAEGVKAGQEGRDTEWPA